MVASVRVDVKPELLRWARERAGLDKSAIAKDKSLKAYPLWEKGEKKPTWNQILRFADKTHVAVGELFLSEPPEEEIPSIKDFRTVGSVEVKRASAEMLDTIGICEERQDWYRAHLVARGEPPLDFVATESTRSDPRKVAMKMRSKLNVEQEELDGLKNWETAFTYLVDKSEELGIMVMRSGVVGTNNSRKLSTEEFRGFALSDQYAPLVFINAADARAAQMFTLAHELAHIWLGSTGISNVKADEKLGSGVERWCNMVAGEFLVPASELKRNLDKQDLKTRFDHAVRSLSRHFKVSSLVIIRRLRDEGHITSMRFGGVYQKELQRFTSQKSRMKGGGNFYTSLQSKLGIRFAHAVIGEALSGRTLYRDAMWLMGIKSLSTFDGLAEEIGFK